MKPDRIKRAPKKTKATGCRLAEMSDEEYYSYLLVSYGGYPSVDKETMQALTDPYYAVEGD
jgi:hypothetical protein